MSEIRWDLLEKFGWLEHDDEQIQRGMAATPAERVEWLEHALVLAYETGVLRRGPDGELIRRLDQVRKAAALREAARHSFPAGDVDTMNEEIERGYQADEA